MDESPGRHQSQCPNILKGLLMITKLPAPSTFTFGVDDQHSRVAQEKSYAAFMEPLLELFEAFAFIINHPGSQEKILMRCPLHINFPLFRAACIIRSRSWYGRNLATMALGGWPSSPRGARARWALSISKPLGKSSSMMSGITPAKKERAPLSSQDSGKLTKTKLLRRLLESRSSTRSRRDSSSARVAGGSAVSVLLMSSRKSKRLSTSERRVVIAVSLDSMDVVVLWISSSLLLCPLEAVYFSDVSFHAACLISYSCYWVWTTGVMPRSACIPLMPRAARRSRHAGTSRRNTVTVRDALACCVCRRKPFL